MIPNKPYLIRALYEWISDNEWTPYILVDATVFGCRGIPKAHINEGRIVFNIAMDVVEDLTLGNDKIEFRARFSGVPTDLYLPISAIVAIYAKENNEGMAFAPEDIPAPLKKDQSSSEKPKGKPTLRIVE
jgi:stringent starvation protein B